MIDFCRKHGYYTTQDAGRCPKCEAENPPPSWQGHVVIFGQDLAKERDYSALIGIDIDMTTAKRRGRIKGWKIWPHVDYSVVVADTAIIFKQAHGRLLEIDKGAAGEAVIELYASRGVPCEGKSFTLINKIEMMEFFRSLRQGTEPQLELPPEGTIPELDSQFAEQERVIEESPFVKYRHPPGRHDDLLWSLLIACDAAMPYFTGGQGWMRAARAEGR